MAETTGLGATIEAAINAAVQKAIGEYKSGTPSTAAATTTKPETTQQQTNEPYQMTEDNLATPTDVSDISTPVENKGSMKVNEYVSPYQKDQQALVKDLGDAKLYETPQKTEDFMKNLFDQQTKKFEYDKENDPLVKSARKEVEQAVKNMATKRGFAFGSQEQDLISQQMAKVEPQFEQIAYNENNDFLNRQLGLANTIMQWEQIQFDRSKDQINLIQTKLDFINQLDQQEFNKFKVILEQRNFNRSNYLNKQKFNLQKKLADQDLALQRLDNLGYVDKQASAILGIPIGTKAKWAQQLAMEQANKIELATRQNKYDIEKQKLDAKIEKELYALKNKLDTESQLKLQAQTYSYKKQLQQMEFDYNKKKQAIQEQQAAEEAAQKEIEAASNYVGGKGSTVKARKASGGMTAAQFKRSYYAEIKKFLKKFNTKKEQNSQTAAKYLKGLKELGVNDSVIAMIRNNYNVPTIKKAVKKTAKAEAQAMVSSVTKKGGSSLDLMKWPGTKNYKKPKKKKKKKKADLGKYRG